MCWQVISEMGPVHTGSRSPSLWSELFGSILSLSFLSSISEKLLPCLLSLGITPKTTYTSVLKWMGGGVCLSVCPPSSAESRSVPLSCESLCRDWGQRQGWSPSLLPEQGLQITYCKVWVPTECEAHRTLGRLLEGSPTYCSILFLSSLFLMRKSGDSELKTCLPDEYKGQKQHSSFHHEAPIQTKRASLLGHKEKSQLVKPPSKSLQTPRWESHDKFYISPWTDKEVIKMPNVQS